MRLIVSLVLFATTAAHADIKVTAVSGQPFGVAEITLTEKGWPNAPNRFQSTRSLPPVDEIIENLGENAFYPVASEQRVRATASWTVQFLFKETEPFKVDSLWQRRKTIWVTPISDPEAHKKLLTSWWRSYSFRASQSLKDSQHPGQVDLYLASTLSRRLGFRQPRLTNPTGIAPPDVMEFVGIMTGTEAIRLAMQKEALLETRAESVRADQPLPEPVTPPPVKIPKANPETEVERLAMAVPHECFYARFGSFKSFLWFRDRVDLWGAELRDLAAIRGLDYELSARLQQQLALPDTELARLLGPAVVEDVAIIGQDTFIREGAAVGVLFQAANNAALSASLNAHRATSAGSDASVRLENVDFNGFDEPVSFLHSDDNRVRSFYARHGDFHLITTSRHIAKRLLECAVHKKDSLGASNEFLHARTVMPLKKDSVFLYLSDAFFRTFVEPRYRIEMTRRARSESEIALVHIAQLAAKAEGQPHATISELIDGNFLPRGFNQRPDGSKLVSDKGTWIDSVRGRRGSFLPIPDVTLSSATEAEVSAYEKFGRMYQRIWEGMDPAMLSLHRATNGKIERLKMHLHVFPIPMQKFGFLNFFHVPKKPMTVTGTEDIPVYAEGYLLGMNPVFIGLLDQDLPFTIEDGRLKVDTSREPGFVVNWGSNASGEAGLAEGVSPLSGREGWTYRSDNLSFFSNSKKDLEKIGPQLGIREARDAAKIRVRLGDLSKMRFSRVLNLGGWLEAKRVANGNSAWLNRLSSQLHVELRQCRDASKQILNADLTHPLGGNYSRQSHRLFYSDDETHRDEYVFPPLLWLSRARFDINAEENVLTSNAEVWLRTIEK